MQDHQAESSSSSSSSSSQRGYGSIISIHNYEDSLPPTTRRDRHVSMEGLEGTSSTEVSSVHHSRKWMLWSLIALSIVLEVTYVLVRTQGGSDMNSMASFLPMLGSSSKHGHHHPDPDHHHEHDADLVFDGIHGFDETQMSWHPHAPTWVNSGMDEDADAAADNHTEDYGWWTTTNNNSTLTFAPPVEKDFWRYTYYEPTLLKDNGMYYAASIPKSAWPVTMTTYFDLNGGTPHAQFDQAGLYLRLDEQHWIKTGIEVVDDRPRLSCVVTNGYSDWSTQPIDTNNAFGVWIRIHLLPAQGGSVVVQAKLADDDDWTMIRIAHLEASFAVQEDDQRNLRHGHVHDSDGMYAVGIFAASPTAAGSVATFSNFSILPGSDFVHEAS